MKKKLLLYAILSVVTLPLCAAKLEVKNQSSAAVAVRLGNQKRKTIFAKRIRLTEARPPVFKEPKQWYPDFNRIGPQNTEKFFYRRRHPVKTITFARVNGYEKITGTVEELQKQVNQVSAQYGNLQLALTTRKLFFKERKLERRETRKLTRQEKLGARMKIRSRQRKEKRRSYIYKAIYINGWTPTTKIKKWEYDPEAIYSIQIPVIETFTHTIGNLKNMIVLNSWGNVTELR